ncbi:hypothetical protein OUZ56_007653 [Daphnia magna]|uniref:Uncharacterized protein n=1 Tax=Daphnia magna TaxID=35525 RepID=A0ABR0AAL1_9CRUS|nr:hypothetical protein OUZ56_007653 [Daphnia magna]
MQADRCQPAGINDAIYIIASCSMHRRVGLAVRLLLQQRRNDEKKKKKIQSFDRSGLNRSSAKKADSSDHCTGRTIWTKFNFFQKKKKK